MRGQVTDLGLLVPSGMTLAVVYVFIYSMINMSSLVAARACSPCEFNVFDPVGFYLRVQEGQSGRDGRVWYCESDGRR